MKKLFALILVLALALSCAACGSEPAQPAESSAPAESAASEAVPASAPAEPASEAAAGAAYEITATGSKTWTDSIGTAWNIAMIEFTNTGSTNLYVDSCKYTLEDADGNEAGLFSAPCEPAVIAPGEKAYLFNHDMVDDPFEGELTVVPSEAIEETAVEPIRLELSEVELAAGDSGAPVVRGCVTNSTEEEQSFVIVSAWLYDADGNCMAQASTSFFDPVLPGDKLDFELDYFVSLPDSISADSVADYVVRAYPLQYQS